MEVVGVDGPDHDAGGAAVGREARLGRHAGRVVVGDPLEPLVHEGDRVAIVPLLRPAVLLPLFVVVVVVDDAVPVLSLLLADLVVAQEAVLPGIRTLERG